MEHQNYKQVAATNALAAVGLCSCTQGTTATWSVVRTATTCTNLLHLMVYRSEDKLSHVNLYGLQLL